MHLSLGSAPEAHVRSNRLKTNKPFLKIPHASLPDARHLERSENAKNVGHEEKEIHKNIEHRWTRKPGQSKVGKLWSRYGGCLLRHLDESCDSLFRRQKTYWPTKLCVSSIAPVTRDE
jgi:hypothetical protein